MMGRGRLMPLMKRSNVLYAIVDIDVLRPGCTIKLGTFQHRYFFDVHVRESGYTFQMRVIQTVPLTAGVSTSSGLHWSEDDKVCALTNKGLLIYELIPNPCFTAPQLNWRRTMIPNPERGNPYLHDVGIDRDTLMNELSLDDKGRN